LLFVFDDLAADEPTGPHYVGVYGAVTLVPGFLQDSLYARWKREEEGD
jgi:hypothetical protein